MLESPSDVSLLTVNALSLRRGGRDLFTGLSFDVRPSQLWQLEGANGAGKTSLLRILCGLSRYGYEGEVQRPGGQLYVGHKSSVKSLLTPRENLAWHSSGEYVADDGQIEDALSRVGLYGFEDVPSHTLSAGQHRRVNLARLYLSTAPLWLLDEPFTAIDRAGVVELESLLDKHVSNGGAVVMTSHQAVSVHAEVHSIALGAGGGTVSTPGSAAFCMRLFRRQLTLAVRRPIDILNPLLFFAMVVALFPLGLGPAPDQLAAFAPGILWIITLLSNLLTSDSVFRSDYEDGSLEQLLLSSQPLYLSVLAYIGAHWLVTGFLLSIVSPLFAVMLNLPAGAVPALVASLLIGSAVLSLVGAIGAALTVGLKRGGMLISLLILPLYMPVLIFGSAAVQAAVQGGAVASFLAILGAMLSLAIALAPLAVAAGLRITIDA